MHKYSEINNLIAILPKMIMTIIQTFNDICLLVVRMAMNITSFVHSNDKSFIKILLSGNDLFVEPLELSNVKPNRTN